MSWLLGHVNSDDEEETPVAEPKSEQEQEGEKAKEQQDSHSLPASFWGALNTLKMKSLSAIETTKKDFSEFGSAFSSETKEIREEVTEVFKPKPVSEEDSVEGAPKAIEEPEGGPGVLARAEEKLTDNLEKISQGVENLAEKVWGGAVTLLPSIFGMSGPDEPIDNDKGGRVTKEQELKALQSNSMTYSGAIEQENAEAFEALTQDFSDRYESFWSQEVMKMLANPLIRAHYDQLVPEVLSEDAFWCHYVFRKKAFDLKHERKQQLESRLAQSKNDNSFGDLAWDDDEEPNKHFLALPGEIKITTEVSPKESPTAPPPTPASVFSESDKEPAISPVDSSNVKEDAVLTISVDSSTSSTSSSQPATDVEPEPEVRPAIETAEPEARPAETEALAENTASASVGPIALSSSLSSEPSKSSFPDIASPSPPASPTLLPIDSPSSFSPPTPTSSEPSFTRLDSSPATSLTSSALPVSSLPTSSPAPSVSTAGPVAVIHLQREISGSPENSDWESNRVAPSQSDSEPWDAGVEDAVLKAMCETPDLVAGEVDPALDGLILVPQGDEPGTTNKDDWDQWD